MVDPLPGFSATTITKKTLELQSKKLSILSTSCEGVETFMQSETRVLRTYEMVTFHTQNISCLFS